ncbi:ParB/RepB/Spo0J family partition protein [Candidatus Saccharibacteria bacterium]|nr:ParB/RepB/Spo0J family partition protein [Candidatus Saccharibacteria bacterium]
MAKKQSLGRGFDALIPKDLDKTILEEDKSRVQKLLISDIVPNPDQPRREHTPEGINELTLSVKRHGVLQPIIVVRYGNGYRIVAGERRWRAAKAAGLKDMPAIVRSLQELEQIELALIENIQRVDLSPLEQAMAVYKLQQQFNLNLDEIAKKLGKATSTISNLTRLLGLPDTARDALRQGKISEGHARAILALKHRPDKQGELLSSILNNKWNVRQAEQFAIAVKRAPRSEQISPHDDKIVKAISRSVGNVVKINRKARGGQLTISFKNDQELAELAKKLQQ